MNDTTTIWLKLACLAIAVAAIAYYIWLDYRPNIERSHRFYWKWLGTFWPRSIDGRRRGEMRLLPELKLEWIGTDNPRLDHRQFSLVLTAAWLVWGGFAAWHIQTKPSWFKSRTFKDRAEELQNHLDRLDAAQARRLKRAGNRAMDKLRSAGVIQ